MGRMATGLPNPLQRRYSTLLRSTHPSEADRSHALLRAVILGLPHGTLAEARLGMPPHGAAADPTIHASGATWLYLTANSVGKSGRYTAEANWKAMIAAGAYREAAHVLRLDDLLGVSVDVAYPDRSRAGASAKVIGRSFGKPAFSAAVARREIAAALVKALPGKRASISFLNGFAPAPIVTVRLDSITGLTAAQSLYSQIFGTADHYEGALLRVLDAKGKLASVVGFAARTGSGVSSSNTP
jgi:hypothetical protein